MKIRALLIALALVALSACGGTTAEPEQDRPAASEKTEQPKPEYDGDAFAATVESELEAALGGREIADGCDMAALTWQCFYEGIESSAKGRVDVQLSYPGDFTKSEKQDHAERVHAFVFNMAGSAVKDLGTVVVYADGLDVGTGDRDDFPLADG